MDTNFIGLTEKGELRYGDKDPSGLDAHETGAKLDDGKVLGGLVGDFGLALTEVAKVGTYGANKYTRGGWQHVENGVERYGDAMWRHMLLQKTEGIDPESGIEHEIHAVWNAIAKLELRLRGTTL